MKKRILSIFLILMLCLGMLPMSVSAAADDTFVVDGLTYTITAEASGDTPGTVSLSDGKSASSDVTIPETVTNSSSGNTYAVTAIGNRSFESNTDLTSVAIPEGVAEIGLSAFAGCFGLESVSLPGGLTAIGESAFRNTVLTSVVIPDSVTSIGDAAFASTSLKSVDLPENDSFTAIPPETFYSCTALDSITIPDNVTSIGNKAFYGCPRLIHVDIPALTGGSSRATLTIGNNAFPETTLYFNGGTMDVQGIGNAAGTVITGGSINFTDAPEGVAPTNANGDLVYLTSAVVQDFSGTKQTMLPVTGLLSSSDTATAVENYGCDSMMTDTEGKLYLWLPAGESLQECWTDGGGGGTIIDRWQYSDGDSTTQDDSFTTQAAASSIVFEPYLEPGTTFPIIVDVLGYPNAQGFVYAQSTTPNVNTKSLNVGEKAESYRLMIDSDSTTAGVNPLPGDYSVVGLYLNEELPADGNYSISNTFTTGGSNSWTEGGVTYGGPTYQFTMPEEAVSITAVVRFTGTPAATNPTVMVNGVTMQAGQFLPSGATSDDALTTMMPDGGYAWLHENNGVVTLELSGATFTDAGLQLSSNNTDPTITIRLVGENALAGASSAGSAGIFDAYEGTGYGGTDITFTGSGSLTATGGDTDGNISAGISGGGSITVESGVTIVSTGGNATSENGASYGIRAAGSINLAGNVTAVGVDFGVMTSSGDISITGGAITASGGTALQPGVIPEGSVTCTLSPVKAGDSADTAAVVWDGTGDLPDLTAYKYVQAPADVTAPTVITNSVNRTSDAEATVKFTSNEAGTYYYAVVDSGADAPSVDTTGAGTACDTTVQTISLTGLAAGAKDIYVVVMDAAGNASEATKATIPAYEALVLTVTFDANGGGGTMASVTVNEGDTYTLPANGFTAPAGKRFKAWSIGGTEYAVGASYTVSADTTITAIWEDIPAEAPTLDESDNLTLTYKNYENEQVSVSVTEEDGYTYSYQWYDALTNQEISGATSAAYTVPNDLAAGSYSYYCVATAMRNDNGLTSSAASSAIAVTVNKAALKITAKDKTAKVGDAAPVLTEADYTVDGLANGDTLDGIGLAVSISYAGTPDMTQSGTTDIVVSGAGETTNYTVDYVNGTLTVSSKNPQTITAADVTATYGDSGLKVTASTSGDGALSYAVTAGADVISVDTSGNITVKKAGTATITVTAAETDTYAATTKEVPVTVGRKAVTVAPKAVSVTVNGTATLELVYTGLVDGETITPDSVELKLYKSDGTEISVADAVKTAGTYTIKWVNYNAVNFSDADNYNVSTTETAQFVVSSSGGDSSGGDSSGGGAGGGGTGGSGGTAPVNPTPPTASVTIPISGEENSIDVDASVSGSKATVDDVDLSKLDTVIGEDVDTGVVTIDFSGLGTSIDTVEIPSDVVKQIAEAVNDPNNDAESLEIVLSDGTSIEFDAVALGEKSAQADGLDITISIKHSEDAGLTAAQKNAVGGNVAYDINVTSGGNAISDMGGKVTVHAPYELREGEIPRGVVVYYIDENGSREACETSYDSARERVGWKTDHLSLYMIGYDEELAESCPKDETCPMYPFIDVDMGAWYHNGVHYAIESGLMKGTNTTENVFSPDGTITRAQIVTILHRLEGEPICGQGKSGTFGDVPDYQWYTEAVEWAAAYGIVEGYGDEQQSFGPNDFVTREQFAAILWRYAGHKGYDVSVGENTNILSYEDAFAVSEYAIPAMQWACGAGIVEGIGSADSGMLINPQGNATRAQAAVIIMRFCENVTP